MGAPAPGVGAPAGPPAWAPARALPAHHRLRGLDVVRDTGNTDPRQVEVIPGGTDMGGV